MSIDSAYAYWIAFRADNFGDIMRVPIQGGSTATLAADQLFTTSVLTDSSTLYWTVAGNPTSGSPALIRMLTAGSSVATFHTGGSGDVFGALSADTAFVYFGSVSEPSLKRKPKGGGPLVTLASGIEVGKSHRIVVDAAFAYWASDDRVGRVALAGGTAQKLWPPAGVSAVVYDLAIHAGNLYFQGDTDASRIYKLATSGGSATVLAPGPVGYIVVDGSGVYLALPSAIQRLSLDGVPMNDVVTGLEGSSVLAVDSTSIYYTQFKALSGNHELWRIAK